MELLIGLLSGGGLAALLGAALAVFRASSERDSMVGATAKALAEAAGALVVPLQAELGATRERVVVLETRISDVHRLHLQCEEREKELRVDLDALRLRLDSDVS